MYLLQIGGVGAGETRASPAVSLSSASTAYSYDRGTTQAVSRGGQRITFVRVPAVSGINYHIYYIKGYFAEEFEPSPQHAVTEQQHGTCSFLGSHLPARGMTMMNQTGASGAQPSPEPTSLRTTHFRPAGYPRGERLTVQPSVRRVPIGGGMPGDQFAGTSAQQTSNEYRLLAEPELSPVVSASAGSGSQIASVSRPAVTIQPRQGMSTVVHPVVEPQSLSREGFGGPESRVGRHFR
ncbi:unnamed protein product [Gongylonema pulchrum]|uniref:Uncharacterized protein n=1 Tax=Gongylonema pulchrum TaxID=637853 RepID=A0A183E3I1_9BILA|nr:unnamed protein product [Gongylonema pulchrum]